jgi:DNA helicase-2/ATP-dependent DNA helicase PcrA
MHTKIILGPPGTGKTTTLLGIIEEALKTVTPEKIAFVSFTNKAVEEAIDRASLKFKLPKKRFVNFRTLHSLAYANTTVRKAVFGKEQVKELNKRTGLRLTGNIKTEYESNTVDDKLLFLVNFATCSKKPLREIWAQADDNLLAWSELKRFSDLYADYKRIANVIDFTDMLDMYVKNDNPGLEVDLFIVDEAQDVNPLQWDVVKKAATGARELIVAGDDDQAIFSWNGANVEALLSMPCDEKIVLPLSYRLPSSIYKLATKITKQISKREKKTWAPSDNEGCVQFIADLSQVPLKSGGDYLLLVRTNYQIKKIAEDLRDSGIYYRARDKNSVETAHKRAIQGYQCLKKGKRIKGLHLTEFCRYALLKQRESRAELGKEDFPRVDFSLDWWQVLKGIPYTQSSYYRNILKQGFSVKDKPKVTIQTIHGAKGGECDNVVLFLDTTRKIHNAFLENGDNEHRVFYVGATRAKRNLYIMEPETICHYPLREML